ncbi:MAG: hypothetical protein ACE5HV_08045 [Acidobacteriota bacterium]
MRKTPVLFLSSLTASERRIYKAVTFIFIGIFLAFMWPIYLYFDRIRPFVIGLPLSLFYLIVLLLVSFLTLLGLYLWESRHDKL